MDEQIKWHIGKEGTTHVRIDVAPFRAYFSWLENGKLVKAADFDRAELGVEIRRRSGLGLDTAPFEQALKELS